jgi:hypothetical protein
MVVQPVTGGGLVLWVAALAEPGTAAGVDVSPILNVGAFGTLSVLLLGFSLTVYRREVRRADAAEAALTALQTKVIDLYAPAAERMAIVVADFVAESRAQSFRDRK